MASPELRIDLRKFEANVRTEVALLGRHGVSVMGVNKVFNGIPETAACLVRGGITVIAESRIENLRALAALPARKCLLRSPALSEIPDVIRFADISLNSEISVLRALSAEALRQSRTHAVLVMVDMGDLREGIWFEHYDQIRDCVHAAQSLPGLSVYGLGTNFNCFGAIKPTRKNGEDFVRIARRLEGDLGFAFTVLSGGNCTSYHLMDKGQWPAGINELRIGGLHQFGIEYVDVKYVEGFHHSTMSVDRVASPLYTLRAEIIECNTKPTVPVGESGVDAFLQPKVFVDRGERKRALLALGRQDLPAQNIWPVDPALVVLGQTSDHTVIDVHDSAHGYAVGDWVEFELDYTALLSACNAPGIRKVCS